MSERPIEIIRREGEIHVPAIVYDGLKPADLVLIERAWGPTRLRLLQELLGRDVPRSEWPESLHWDWSRKADELRYLEATGFGIVCEREWQGVMLTKTVSHVAQLPAEKGRPLVYVDYLESAPWNWRIRPLGQEGQYKAVGTVLFREAVRQSVKEGFHGRVGLHALPKAEEFYRRCGLTPLGRDRRKQNLTYFELGPTEAEGFLRD